MPVSCAAEGCTNRFIKGSEIRFYRRENVGRSSQRLSYRFPISKPQLAAQWVQSLGRKSFVPTANSCLCSEHFQPDCFRDYNGRQFLREDAVPTIFAGCNTTKIELRKSRGGVVAKDPLTEKDKEKDHEKANLRTRDKKQKLKETNSANMAVDMAEMSPCSVGEQLQEASDCHKTFLSQEVGLTPLGVLPERDCLLLQLRTGLMGLMEQDTVCLHHHKVYVELYEEAQRVCCDPFNSHRKAVRKGLRPIDLDDASFLTERFARHFVPGWKLCNRCTQLATGYTDLEAASRQRCRLDKEGKTAKALKSLEFTNPGRQTDFAAENNRRDKRRVNKYPSSDKQTMGTKSKVYDSKGLLIANGCDVCDCLDVECMGCFYPCPGCGSRKCGVECRCNRKWLYEQVEVEGGEIIRNKYAS